MNDPTRQRRVVARPPSLPLAFVADATQFVTHPAAQLNLPLTVFSELG